MATRATCDRKHVGALLVRDRTILSTGYNGSIRGLPHCDEVGHMMENGHCVATVHAEANAIIQAAKNGVRHRRRDHLHDRQPVLALLQADRQLRAASGSSTASSTGTRASSSTRPSSKLELVSLEARRAGAASRRGLTPLPGALAIGRHGP